MLTASSNARNGQPVLNCKTSVPPKIKSKRSAKLLKINSKIFTQRDMIRMYGEVSWKS